MKDKILFVLSAAWAGFIAFTSSFCIGWIALDITGHAKGYGYDLGPEKDTSIILGFIELIIWLALALPANVYVFKWLWGKDKRLVIAHIAANIILFILGVYIILGEWSEFLYCLGFF